MAESLLEKARRLNIQPSGTTTESLLQKAQRLGIEPPVKAPNYFQRIGQTFKREGEEVVGAVKEGAEAIQRGGMGAVPGVLRAGLRPVGSVAETAFSPILEVPLVKKAVDAVVGKALENPNVNKLVSDATELAKKYPNQAKDLYDVVNIVSLGVAPKVASTVGKEVKAIGSDVAQATRIALTESEQVTQAELVKLFQKSIKPTVKKTLGQGQKYENDVVNALKTIKSNADNLNIEDATGELVSRTPQTLSELAQALDQTKKLVFDQYDGLARQAGKGGAVIDAQPIADEVLKVAQNKALQITNPELVKYAEQWAERLQGLGQIDTQTAQEIVKNLNNSLSAFYRNPTYESATKVAIDAGIANNFRKGLDDAIEGATGQEYQALKNQYGALKAIENDVVRAATRDAKKNAKGLLDYTDIFTSGQMLGGILSLNPAMFTKGAIERGFKEWFKSLNDPNRAVGNMFDMLDASTVQPFTPESATFKFLQNPKIGNSIEDVSKSSNAPNLSKGAVGTQGKVLQTYPDGTPISKELQPLAQEARKYKSAEEFVRKQPVVYHGSRIPLKKFSNKKGGAFFTDSMEDASGFAGTPDNVYEGYLSLKKPLVIDAKGAKWNELNTKWGKSTQEVVANAHKEGYDGITFKNIVDNAGDTADWGGQSTIHYVYKPEDSFINESQLTDIWNKVNKK